MSRPVELRSTPGVVTLRSDTATRGSIIHGYAATFERRSRDLGGFVEVVGRGAFSRARNNGWPGVVALFEHRPDMLLGTAAARTLTLSVDDTGLHYEVDPPRSRADVIELVERGEVRHSSFAFRVAEDSWGVTPQGYPLRRLLVLDLVDVSPVISPAYVDSTAGLRSLADHSGTSLEQVRILASSNRLRELVPGPPRRISGQDALARLNARDGRPRMTGAQARAALDALDRRKAA
jgi:HK97 family phage prohead protease